jgi:hypothetical protein
VRPDGSLPLDGRGQDEPDQNRTEEHVEGVVRVYSRIGASWRRGPQDVLELRPCGHHH